MRLQVVLGGKLFAALCTCVGLLALFQHHLGPDLRAGGGLFSQQRIRDRERGQD
jgi:hypothetical protein